MQTIAFVVRFNRRGRSAGGSLARWRHTSSVGPSVPDDLPVKSGLVIPGAELTELEIRVAGDGSRGLSVNGEGTDAGEGRVILSGQVDPVMGETLAYKLSLELSRMLLVNLDDIRARASGRNARAWRQAGAAWR